MSEPAAIRDLELLARTTLSTARHGLHRAVLAGAGAEIRGLRPYRQGDAATDVDWKRSARGDRLYAREHADTAQVRSVIVLDASRSMTHGHGVGEPSKLELARRTAASLATLLVDQGDTVGLQAGTAPGQWVPPAGGRHHLHGVLSALAAADGSDTTEPADAIAAALARVGRPSLLIALSDLWDAPRSTEVLRRAASAGHDVVVFHVVSPFEFQLPEAGAIEFEDAESGAVVTLDAAAVRDRYAAACTQWQGQIDADLRGARLDVSRLRTDVPLVSQVRAFLARRAWS